MKTIAAALTVLALAVPAAQADDFPPNEDPHCTYEVKKRYRLEPVLRKGLPVSVTCDGPGETSSIVLIESRKQNDRWEDLHNHGIPGISRSNVVKFEAPGTATIRVEIIPKKFFRRYAKTKFRVLLGVVREPPYHTSVDPGKVITLVR
jgi:hypothetical protein